MKGDRADDPDSETEDMEHIDLSEPAKPAVLNRTVV